MQESGAVSSERLRRYWLTHIPWGTDGDFTMCVREVGKYMTAENAKGYCANLHKRATGMWPGDRRNR